MKSLTGIIVGALVVAAVIWGVVDYSKGETNSKMLGQGSLYVGVTDVTADIQNVEDINLAVRKVEIYSASQGWIAVSTNNKNYDLLTLKAKGVAMLYAKKDLPAGTYSKVRVTLGDANVKTKTKGTIRAVLPTSQIVMNESVKINDGQDSHIKLDFLADKSLHSTSDGKFVFAAVVKSEAKSNARVTTGDNDVVSASGGTVDDSVSVGVDLAGSSRPNFQLSTDNTLQIKSSSGGVVNFTLGGKNFTADDNMDKEDEVEADTDVDGSLDSNTTLNVNERSKADSGDSGTNIKGSGTVKLETY